MIRQQQNSAIRRKNKERLQELMQEFRDERPTAKKRVDELQIDRHEQVYMQMKHEQQMARDWPEFTVLQPMRLKRMYNSPVFEKVKREEELKKECEARANIERVRLVDKKN